MSISLGPLYEIGYQDGVKEGKAERDHLRNVLAGLVEASATGLEWISNYLHDGPAESGELWADEGALEQALAEARTVMGQEATGEGTLYKVRGLC